MSASRATLRGNKVFLPKIKYQNVKKKPLSDILQLDENNSDSENLSDEGENWSKSSSRVIPLWRSELEQATTFTRFTVLPPILGRRYSPKDFENNKLSSGLKTIQDTKSLPNNFKGKFVKRATYLKRQKATDLELNSDELRKSRSESEAVLPKARKQSNKQFRKSYSETNKEFQLDERDVPKTAVSDLFLEKGANSKKCKVCCVLGPDVNGGSCSHKHRFFEEHLAGVRSKQETLSGNQTINDQVTSVRRCNSEGITGTGLKANAFIQLPKSEDSPELIVLDRRPLSRCQIDLDLNQMENSYREETPHGKAHQPEQENTFSSATTSSEESDLFSTTSDSGRSNFESPQIQILIETIDDAKDKLPKQTLSVPFTSTREQRRRSALCRNNTKQVDDFLLVHNLKDLGLL